MLEPRPYWVDGAIAERHCRANPSDGDAKATLTTGLRCSAFGKLGSPEVIGNRVTEAAMRAASLHTLKLSPPHRLPPSWGLIPAWRWNDKAHAHPELTCGLPIGPKQPLCGLGVCGAALEPASHEKINPRGKSPLSRCQHRPRAQALIGWSFDVVAGVHLALLPVRRRERPCAESYTLALRISPASS